MPPRTAVRTSSPSSARPAWARVAWPGSSRSTWMVCRGSTAGAGSLPRLLIAILRRHRRHRQGRRPHARRRTGRDAPEAATAPRRAAHPGSRRTRRRGGPGHNVSAVGEPLRPPARLTLARISSRHGAATCPPSLPSTPSSSSSKTSIGPTMAASPSSTSWPAGQRAPCWCSAWPDTKLLESRPGWGGGLTNALTVFLEPLPTAATARLMEGLLEGGVPEPLRQRVVDL